MQVVEMFPRHAFVGPWDNKNTDRMYILKEVKSHTKKIQKQRVVVLYLRKLKYHTALIIVF